MDYEKIQDNIIKTKDDQIEQLIDLCKNCQDVSKKSTQAYFKSLVGAFISIVLVVFIFGACFVWYESQYDYVEANISAEGEEANAQYNDISGNQYYNENTEKGSEQ